MKGDFSRVTFDPARHFSRVLQQQGRVQLDADSNEQTAILLHYLQTLAKDLIGEHGGPQGEYGFKISAVVADAVPADDFTIGNGRYYVDGILIENEGWINNGKATDFTYLTQPYYRVSPLEELLKNQALLVYVDVWEQHISYIEDDSIREVALGGVDTAARARVVWQIKTVAAPVESADTLSESQWLNLKSQWQPKNRGSLKAQAKRTEGKDTNLCVIAPEASFRGSENQLYRVEIHQGGSLVTRNGSIPPTFKWSRDNGSVVSRVTQLNNDALTLESALGFSVGQWVELTNDAQDLRGENGTLLKIINIDSNTLYLDLAPAPTISGTEPEFTKARLWNSGAISITESNTEGDWIALEDGVQIQFQKPDLVAIKDLAASSRVLTALSQPSDFQSIYAPRGGEVSLQRVNQYRTGDYWLIPARVATGDVEWPGAVGNPDALPPHGVEHHYAPLAIINTAAESVVDLRKQITPIAHLLVK